MDEPAAPMKNSAASVGEPEPGYLTTEFWVTVVTLIMAVLAMVFHRDFSSYIQPIAVGAAAIMVVGYQLARGIRKSATSKAQFAAAVASSTPPAVAPQPSMPAGPPSGPAAGNGAATVVSGMVLPTAVAVTDSNAAGTDRWILLGRG